MKITYKEAETLIKAAFGDNEKIPPICYAGNHLQYDTSKAAFSTDYEFLYILDTENDTIWAINLETGCMQHKGTGRGCFYTEPVKWFEAVNKS